MPIWYPGLKPFLTKSVISSSISLNVFTFSNGTGLAPSIRLTSLSLPYLIRYSLASLQSSNVVKKQTSAPRRLISSCCKAWPGSSSSTASITFSLSSK